MSFIHDALLKAQKEKDAKHPRYQRILSWPKSKRPDFSRRAVWMLGLVVILLAFGIYSWLDSGGKRTRARLVASTPDTRVIASRPITKAVPVEPEAKTGSERRADPKKFCDRAKHFQKIGRLREARRFYQRALAIDPGLVDALNNLGVVYIQEGNYMQAQRNFENAIQQKPGYVDPYYNLACLYALQGQAKNSLVHLKKAISLDKSAREWAQKDKDLGSLRDLPEFKEITKSAGVPKQ